MDKNNLKNNMSAKNWVKGFVFTSLILLLAVILINILRDPMMLTPFSNKLNNDVKIVNERQQKINYMTYNKIKYNGVVLGSSRATYFDTTVFPKEKNLYNISFNGGILPEYKSYLDYFDKKNNAEIEYIYLGLDFFQYITLYETSEKAEKYIKNTEDKLYRIKTLLSANSLIYSLYPYKFSQQYLVRKGGYKITNEKMLDKDKKKRINEHLNVLYTQNFNPPYKATLIEIKNAYPNAKFIVFTTPEPKTLLNYLMHDKKFYYDYEKWLKDTLEVFGEIHHFDYFNEITLNEEKYFLDTHHLTTNSTNYIIYNLENMHKKLDNFGFVLNKNNLQAFLQTAKKEFKIDY